jgi:hypothetical protein
MNPRAHFENPKKRAWGWKLRRCYGANGRGTGSLPAAIRRSAIFVHKNVNREQKSGLLIIINQESSPFFKSGVVAFALL